MLSRQLPAPVAGKVEVHKHQMAFKTGTALQVVSLEVSLSQLHVTQLHNALGGDGMLYMDLSGAGIDLEGSQ